MKKPDELDGLGRAIRLGREKKQMSLETLGFRVGKFSRQHAQQIEGGSIMPHRKILRSICQHLGLNFVDVAELAADRCRALRLAYYLEEESKS